MLVDPPAPDPFTLSLFGPLLVLPAVAYKVFCVLPTIEADWGLPTRLYRLSLF